MYIGGARANVQEQIAEQHSSFLRFNPYYLILSISGIKHNNKINTHTRRRRTRRRRRRARNYGVCIPYGVCIDTEAQWRIWAWILQGPRGGWVPKDKIVTGST